VFELPAFFAAAIGSLDLFVVVAYLAITTLVGIFLGRGQAGNKDYFLGGHRLPTWALLVSIVATETSTVTFLSVPGKAFVDGGNFTFLQIAFGYIIGRFAIIVLLLPGYFRGEMLSAYQVLERRFGVTTRRLASLVFLVTRNVADGLRLFLTALALKLALDVDMMTCILVTSIATAVYACAGGVRSVVWNDCIQFAVYMLGAFAAAWLLLTQIPGGWGQLVEFGNSTGRWQLFDFDPSPTKKSITFWSGFIGGGFLSLATHGVDQLIVQRYLCAKNNASAAWALGLSGFVVLLQFAVFLFIGVELACFNSVSQGIDANISGDEAFMSYVVKYMGVGLKGLILAAILAAAMSTLASSFNSSASSLMGDWLTRYLPQMSDASALRLARALTIIFALIQAAVAIGAYMISLQQHQAIVDAVLKIAGFAIGLLLGLYGLGLMWKQTSETIALVAFVVGAIVTSFVAFKTQINGYWYTLVGSGTIVVTGLFLTLIVPSDDGASGI
jgi:SSS family transporter